jgi:hypothetical protein
MNLPPLTTKNLFKPLKSSHEKDLMSKINFKFPPEDTGNKARARGTEAYAPSKREALIEGLSRLANYTTS